MNYLSTLVLTVIIVFSTALKAQQSVPLKINSIDDVSLNKAEGGEADKTYFTLNSSALENEEFKKGAIFEMETGQGEVSAFKIIRERNYRPGITSYMAAEVGQPDNKFSFSYGNGTLIGLYHESHSSAVLVAEDQEIGKAFLTRNKSLLGEVQSCAVHESEDLEAIPNLKSRFAEERKKAFSNAESGAIQRPVYASEEDSITLDIMLVYTDSAEVWADNSSFGNIDFILAQSINLSQTALDNSETGIELRPAHIHKTIYRGDNDEDISAGDHLRRFTQDRDNPSFGENNTDYIGYMEEVHDLREKYGIDLMALIMSEPNTGGIAWVLNSPSGSAIRAFSVNRVQQVASNYTLVHEIGHNMGNSHSRTQQQAAASESGALFHYSVGYQNVEDNFVTVMAYNEGGQLEAPIFSSPSLSFDGSTVGTDNRNTPENATRTLKQVKRTIAGYRPSRVDSPIVSVSTDDIEVTLNREDEISVPFSISNTGESGLVWDIDFDFPGNSVGKRAKSTAGLKTMKPAQMENITRIPANYSFPQEAQQKRFQMEELLYSTSFENFPTGEYAGFDDWRTLGGSTFEITSGNGSDGNRSLRMTHDGSENTQFVSAPFFGFQPFGNYELSVDFSIGGVEVDSEVYDFYFFDGKNGDFSSGVIIADGTIYAAELGEGGQLQFAGTGAVAPANRYHTLKIVYNTNDGVIEYYLNGSPIYEADFLNGRTPSEMRVLLRSEAASGTRIDVDNFQLKQINAPYSWLSVENMSGVSFEQESSDATLNFNTRGLSAGTYETTLTVTTNDPQNRIIEVPVTLNVNDVVSNEMSTTPEAVTLGQNYPNPFNPATSINYTLQQAGKVQLEVFNMQGQRVATLVNENKGAGEHQVNFDASNLASGIYVYRLQAGTKMLTRKMALIK
jgi:hypothetical protein